MGWYQTLFPTSMRNSLYTVNLVARSIKNNNFNMQRLACFAHILILQLDKALKSSANSNVTDQNITGKCITHPCSYCWILFRR